MKKRVLIICAALLLLAFLLFFTAPGHRLLQTLFPSLNLSENLIIFSGSQADDSQAYTTSLIGELPGSYRLQSLRSPELELSADDLAAIQALGIPLQLVLSEAGSAALRIFDLNLNLTFDAGRMLFHFKTETFPFFYQDGLLTLWEGETRLVFEKEVPGQPSA